MTLALFAGMPLCSAQTAPAKATTSTSVPKSNPHRTSAPASPHHHTATAAKKSTTSSRSKRRKRTANWRSRGQQKIDPQRAHDIQDALIREHYLEGNPSGVWDDATQKAMQRYQADHGWQSTMTPDSRALIKLGLGPDHAHLLNPESAMTGGDPPHTDPPHASETISPAASTDIPVSSTPLPAGDPAPVDPPKK